MIHALKGKRKQLSTEESNKQRLVTKIRWVLEAVQGILKQNYHLLDHKIDSKFVPNNGIYLRLASFLNNVLVFESFPTHEIAWKWLGEKLLITVFEATEPIMARCFT